VLEFHILDRCLLRLPGPLCHSAAFTGCGGDAQHLHLHDPIPGDTKISGGNLTKRKMRGTGLQSSLKDPVATRVPLNIREMDGPACGRSMSGKEPGVATTAPPTCH
jgi:hypothetical protein